jgi:hypothetical protein
MNKTLFIYFCLCSFIAKAQEKNDKPKIHKYSGNGKHFSFNPLGLAEPQIALGMGFGNHFSERSEYFAELSYIAKNPLYGDIIKSLHGMRLITQYRYHFLQPWRPIATWGLGFGKSRVRQNHFIAAEFRLKTYNFSDKNTFVNRATSDTLNNFLYKANALSIGGGIAFGSIYRIGKSGNWQIEATIGIGAKQKFVHYINKPDNYSINTVKGGFGLKPPQIYEAVGMPYVPCTIRLRYLIN